MVVKNLIFLEGIPHVYQLIEEKMNDEHKCCWSPEHLSPNVSTSGRIFGRALVGHTTMGTLSGL